jgi:branched-chain amino acid transport system substrate-binding protein
LSDFKLILEKMNEFGLGKGRLPIIANGGAIGTPEILKLVGKDLLEGLMFSIANWSGKGMEAIAEDFKKDTGEPWLPQDPLCAYGHIMVMREAIEAAGKADRKAVGEAMRKLDTKGGSGKFFPGGNGVMKFDEKGRRVGAEVVFVQWQNGIPVAVYPEDFATAKPTWVKR